ncbi:hypothetical protein Hypma_002068 [Hypsizygus marmoreus]|uniref:Uncharacterized protein n=1 Tax=Hypsizygus marmoreus TaxID=39966 RepID=A0A369J4W7_HYPMA|nr:hypothetical protein Hypma_002068 [Hypsizygus marmoreus]
MTCRKSDRCIYHRRDAAYSAARRLCTDLHVCEPHKSYVIPLHESRNVNVDDIFTELPRDATIYILHIIIPACMSRSQHVARILYRVYAHSPAVHQTAPTPPRRRALSLTHRHYGAVAGLEGRGMLLVSVI